MSAWGIDLGGTKIEGVVMDDPTHPEWRFRERVPTEAHLGYEAILERIERLIEWMERDTGPRPATIGFSTPGAREPSTGLMKNCNTTCLNGKRLQDDLERRLGARCPVVNDANCFALAEAAMGAGRGASVVFGVILGTGVGGGLVVNGQVLNGAHGIAGEWGHNVLIPDGDSCYCGRKGCVETVISGPALERHYFSLTGESLRLPDIVSKASQGSAAAQATVDRLVTEFGRAVAVVINVVDPDVIVLGGGVGSIAALAARAPQAIVSWLFNPTLETRLVRPVLGDSAGALGACVVATS